METIQLLWHLGLDVVMIGLLAYALYYRRHTKADLALAYVALNLGVFAAVAMLANVEVGMGFAFGLFGILSIIRLRSTTLSQVEVAYYFVSLVLGLVHALAGERLVLVVGFDVLLLAVLFILDRDRIAARTREQRVVLDRAITDNALLREELEFRLGAPVVGTHVEELDFVRDMTVVVARVDNTKTLTPSAASQLRAERIEVAQ